MFDPDKDWDHEDGALRVWWIPQVPMKAFYVHVQNLEQAKLVLKTLARYDLFQFENHVKPDYSNAGGLQAFDKDALEWEEWHNEDDEDIDEVMENEE